jgi:hypothetical protein
MLVDPSRRSIVAIGSTKLTGVSDVVAATAARKPGDRSAISVIHDVKHVSLTVTLAKQPSHRMRRAHRTVIAILAPPRVFLDRAECLRMAPFGMGAAGFEPATSRV